MAEPTKEIPEAYYDILEAKCFPHVATIRPDGMISSNPICLLWDGKLIRFSTTKGRVKYHNQIARKYMDTDEYPFDRPGDERVTVTVHPEQVSAVGVNPDYNDGKVPEDWTKG